jgi:hypothetical protein
VLAAARDSAGTLLLSAHTNSSGQTGRYSPPAGAVAATPARRDGNPLESQLMVVSECARHIQDQLKLSDIAAEANVILRSGTGDQTGSGAGAASGTARCSSVCRRSMSSSIPPDSRSRIRRSRTKRDEVKSS